MANAPFEAHNGCIYRVTHDGALRHVVAKFAPLGFKARAFADPEAQRMAEIACAAMNAAEQVSA